MTDPSATNLQFQPAYPFEAVLQTDGRLHLAGVPDDKKIIDQIVQALVQTQPFGAVWEADYRTLYLLSGASDTPIATQEEVQAIAVPHWRRLRGELQGGQLALTERETSTDGENWTPYPAVNDTREADNHPAFELPGEVIGLFLTLHWREGRIDIEPDPPEELLEALEAVVQNLNGHTAETWQAQHVALGGDPKVNPEAKRGSLEVRQLPPLFGPDQQPFARYPDAEFWILVPLEYSPDGKKWESYPLAQAPELPDAGGDTDNTDEGDENNPFNLLSQLFDIQTAAVTVYADGKVEWDEGDIPAEYADSLRQSLLETTGAGDLPKWAEVTADLVPAGMDGVPKAIGFQVMKQLLEGDMLGQSFAPSALTLDGKEWHDLTPPLFEDDDANHNDADQSKEE